MPSRDETDGSTECKKCEERFSDYKTLKKHLKKTRHFVPMERGLQDSYRPGRDGRGEGREC